MSHTPQTHTPQQTPSVIIQRGTRKRADQLKGPIALKVIPVTDLQKEILESFKEYPELEIKVSVRQTTLEVLSEWTSSKYSTQSGGLRCVIPIEYTGKKSIEDMQEELDEFGYQPVLVYKAGDKQCALLAAEPTFTRDATSELHKNLSGHYAVLKSALIIAEGSVVNLLAEPVVIAKPIDYNVDEKQSKKKASLAAVGDLWEKLIEITDKATFDFGEGPIKTSDMGLPKKYLMEIAGNVSTTYPIAIAFAYLVRKEWLSLTEDPAAGSDKSKCVVYKPLTGTFSRTSLSGIVTTHMKRTLQGIYSKLNATALALGFTMEVLRLIPFRYQLATLLSNNVAQKNATLWNCLSDTMLLPALQGDLTISIKYRPPINTTEDMAIARNGVFDFATDTFLQREEGFSAAYRLELYEPTAMYVQVPETQGKIIEDYFYSILEGGVESKYAPVMDFMMLNSVTSRNATVFPFIGEGGAGKSRIISTMTSALGSLAKERKYEEIMASLKHSAGLALYGVTLSYWSEARVLSGLSKLKKYIDSNSINIEPKGVDMKEAPSYAIIVLDTNYMPHISSGNESDIRRLAPIVTKTDRKISRTNMPEEIVKKEALLKRVGQKRFNDLVYSTMVNMGRRAYAVEKKNALKISNIAIELHETYWGGLEAALLTYCTPQYAAGGWGGIAASAGVDYVTVEDVRDLLTKITGTKYPLQSINASLNYLGTIWTERFGASKQLFHTSTAGGVDVVLKHSLNELGVKLLNGAYKHKHPEKEAKQEDLPLPQKGE